jgi:hypothetical protein
MSYCVSTQILNPKLDAIRNARRSNGVKILNKFENQIFKCSKVCLGWQMMFLGVYLLIRKRAGSAIPPAPGRVTFACWQTGEYFNTVANESQEEKTIRLAAEDTEGRESNHGLHRLTRIVAYQRFCRFKIHI